MFRSISSKSAILVLAAATMLTLLGAESLHRAFAVPQSIFPGWSSEEFETRVESIDPARDCVFVGDSRVGWGVADKLVTAALYKYPNAPARALNLGMAASGIDDILGYIRRRVRGKGAVMMINYSPAAFFWFSSTLEPPIKPTANAALEISDRHTLVDRYFNMAITTDLHKIPADVSTFISAMQGEHRPPKKYWESRTVFPEGFVNAHFVSEDGKPVDFAEYQLETYRDTFHAKQKPAALQNLANAFRKDGWNVVMFRLPIGPRMQALEDTLPLDLKPASVAAAAGVPLIDFQTDPRTRKFQTQDQSHLTPASARAIAPFLAEACEKAWTHSIR